MMKKYKIYQLILILTPFVFSFALGLDIYIPIIPQMTHIFDTTPALVHLTLSLFLLTTGLGQLLIGPLSDQFGRKPIFYAAGTLYALGSFGCVFSAHIGWLILSRFICALGACGMLVNSFALVRDLFTGDDSAKVYSFLNGAIGISPTFAPIIGGYLALYYGWQSIFCFLTFIGLIALVITNKFIHETHPVENRVTMNLSVFKRYWTIFTNPQFIVYSCIAGLAEGVFFCFFSVSPFIIIELLEVPTQEFGFYFAVFGAVIALGGFASGKLVEVFGIEKTTTLGNALMFIGGVSMLAWYYLGELSLIGFLLPMVLACTGAVFVVGGCAAAALEPFASIAGTAAAGFGAIEFTISSLIGAILMFFPTLSTVPYGISIVLVSVIVFLIFVSRKKLCQLGQVYRM